MSPPTRAVDLDFARKLIDHCCWEDERVWRLAIAPLTDEQFGREVDFGLGSIQRECAHIMESEWTNLRRLRGEPLPIGELPLNREAMFSKWRAIHADWAATMAELDADGYFADCAFTDGDRAVKLKAWQLIFDVIYQGTTHRSDIMRIVAEVHETPQFDLSLKQFLTGVFRQ